MKSSDPPAYGGGAVRRRSDGMRLKPSKGPAGSTDRGSDQRQHSGVTQTGSNLRIRISFAISFLIIMDGYGDCASTVPSLFLRSNAQGERDRGVSPDCPRALCLLLKISIKKEIENQV